MQAQCRPDLLCARETIGVKTIDLVWLLVHTTGLVKPDDPDAKIKSVAVETFRGRGSCFPRVWESFRK